MVLSLQCTGLLGKAWLHIPLFHIPCHNDCKCKREHGLAIGPPRVQRTEHSLAVGKWRLHDSHAYGDQQEQRHPSRRLLSQVQGQRVRSTQLVSGPVPDSSAPFVTRTGSIGGSLNLHAVARVPHPSSAPVIPQHVCTPCSVPPHVHHSALHNWLPTVWHSPAPTRCSPLPETSCSPPVSPPGSRPQARVKSLIIQTRPTTTRCSNGAVSKQAICT